jgi:hypothetical protein
MRDAKRTNIGERTAHSLLGVATSGAWRDGWLGHSAISGKSPSCAAQHVPGLNLGDSLKARRPHELAIHCALEAAGAEYIVAATALAA